MALIQLPTMTRLRFQDNDLAVSACQTHIPPAISAAAGLSFLASWRGVVQSLSDAVCIDSDLLVRWKENTEPVAGSSSAVLRQGTFIFTTPTPDLATIRVPSIDQALLETSGPYAGIAIDQTQPAVIAFVSAITGGLTGVQACDPFVLDLVALSSAYVELF